MMECPDGQINVSFNPEMARELLKNALVVDKWISSEGTVSGYSVDDDGTLRIVVKKAPNPAGES